MRVCVCLSRPGGGSGEGVRGEGPGGRSGRGVRGVRRSEGGYERGPMGGSGGVGPMGVSQRPPKVERFEGDRRLPDWECSSMLKVEGSRSRRPLEGSRSRGQQRDSRSRRPLKAERRERSNTSLGGMSETVCYQYYIELWVTLSEAYWLLSNWSKRLIGRNNYILIGLKNAALWLAEYLTVLIDRHVALWLVDIFKHFDWSEEYCILIDWEKYATFWLIERNMLHSDWLNI